LWLTHVDPLPLLLLLSSHPSLPAPAAAAPLLAAVPLQAEFHQLMPLLALVAAALLLHLLPLQMLALLLALH
jgi:hypothetical protein